MKIAFISQKYIFSKDEEIKKPIDELARRLARKGNEVFICIKNLSATRIFFESWDIIHWQFRGASFLRTLVKIFNPKTPIISMDFPRGTEINDFNSAKYLLKWNLQRGGYIIYAGQLNRSNRIKYLIETFKNLEDKHLTRGKKLVITGEESQKDEYIKEIKDLARGRENIIFTGSQSGEALEQLFLNAYFFIHPSRSEELTSSLLEAMGYGKAVLASDVQENIGPLNYKTALFFRSGDPSDLEEKMVFFINNPDLVREMGKEARKKIQDEFSWDTIVKKVESIYIDAIHNKKIINIKSNAKNIQA